MVKRGTGRYDNEDDGSRKRSRISHHPAPSEAGECTVFVGNLAFETSWQDLKDHMRQAGNVDSVRSVAYCCGKTYSTIVRTDTAALLGQYYAILPWPFQRLWACDLSKTLRSQTSSQRLERIHTQGADHLCVSRQSQLRQSQQSIRRRRRRRKSKCVCWKPFL